MNIENYATKKIIAAVIKTHLAFLNEYIIMAQQKGLVVKIHSNEGALGHTRNLIELDVFEKVKY